MPFAILSIFVLCWGLPSIKNAINQATTPSFKVVMADGKPRPGPAGWDWPYLHGKVSRTMPVVAKPTAEAARFDFNWLTATGTGCFLAALLAGLLLGLGFRRIVGIFGKTLVRLRFAIIAMTCMLGIGYVTRYSGMDAVLGLASSGVHSNGYSLVRKVVEASDLAWNAPAPFDRSREDALHEAIRARVGESNGRERDESQRHEEIRDDAIPVEPCILGAYRGHATDGQEDDAATEQREAAAHRGSEFLDVQSSNRHVYTKP